MSRSSTKKQLLSAQWVLPFSQAPISNGAVLIQGDSILDIGSKKELQKKYPKVKQRDFKNGVLFPGFVNTHSHLIHNQLPNGSRDFASWFKGMVQRAQKEKRTEKEIKKTIKRGIEELVQTGVTTVADSGPDLIALKLLKKSGLRSIFYQELFGFIEKEPKTLMARLKDQAALYREKLPSRVQLGYAPHSPYTMPTNMFRALSQLCQKERIPFTTHVAESVEEVQFFKKGKGALTEIFPGRQKLLPRSKSSVQYLSANRILGPHLLSAHCVQVDQKDLSILSKKGVKISYCPTSNAFLNVGKAPVADFIDKKIVVGLGTDSTETSGSLNFFQTLRDAALFGSLSAEQVLKCATFGGAKAMNLDRKIGSLKKGKQADLIVVNLKKNRFETPSQVMEHLVWKSQPSDLLLSVVEGVSLF